MKEGDTSQAPRGSPKTEPGAPAIPTALRLFIAYEDYDAGKRAQRTCRQLLQMMRLDRVTCMEMWKFDMLKSRCARTLAQEVTEVPLLLVLAQQHGTPLPVEVRDWIQARLATPCRLTGIIVLLGSAMEPMMSDSSVERELRALAAASAVPVWCLYLEDPATVWSEPMYAPSDLCIVASTVCPAALPVPEEPQTS